MENLFKNGYAIAARMQKSLDNYKTKKGASEQAINTQQEIIDKLMQLISNIEQSYSQLQQYANDEFKRGMQKGIDYEKKRNNPPKYNINKETLRYNSIATAMQKWQNLY